NRQIGSKFKSDNSATLAGLIIDTLGLIPEIGQIFDLFEHRFEILKRTKSQITLLSIQKLHLKEED
ncbi:MAG: hypothetical protein LBF70_01645, partial [Holosporales bacterium]|nr:hypothetical protein [Holosporales bacterium]